MVSISDLPEDTRAWLLQQRCFKCEDSIYKRQASWYRFNNKRHWFHTPLEHAIYRGEIHHIQNLIYFQAALGADHFSLLKLALVPSHHRKRILELLIPHLTVTEKMLQYAQNNLVVGLWARLSLWRSPIEAENLEILKWLEEKYTRTRSTPVMKLGSYFF